MLLADAIRRYERIDRSPYTNRCLHYFLARFARFIGGQRPLEAITVEHIADFLDDARQRCTPVSVHSYGVRLRAFFNWAVQTQLIDTSPAAQIRLRYPQMPTRSKAITPEDLTKIIDQARPHPRNYSIVLFLADTGCRVGALESLTIENLDLNSGRAFVLEKGGRWVYVYFGEETALALRRWLAVRQETDHRYLWVSNGPVAKRIRRHAIRKMLWTLCDKADTRRWSPHSFRHAVGHAYADQRLPVTVTQSKLNHARPEITFRNYYPHGDDRVADVSRQNPLAPLRRQSSPQPGKIILFPGQDIFLKPIS